MPAVQCKLWNHGCYEPSLFQTQTVAVASITRSSHLSNPIESQLLAVDHGHGMWPSCEWLTIGDHAPNASDNTAVRPSGYLLRVGKLAVDSHAVETWFFQLFLR